MKSLLIIFFLSLSSLNLEARDILVTSERSGSHLLMYSINQLTNRQFIYKNQHYPFIDKFDKSKPPFKHCHQFGIPALNDSVILATRDPCEIYLFFYGNFLDQAFNPDVYKNMTESKVKRALKNMDRYIENLKKYDKHNPRRKIIIYYEDLMTKPQHVFHDLGKYLKISPQKVDEFLKNYESHKKICIEKYRQNFIRQNRPYFKAHSKGTNLNFYKELLSEKDLKLVKYNLKEYIPKKLRDKYLQRYYL